jgi:hypothetical protein
MTEEQLSADLEEMFGIAARDQLFAILRDCGHVKLLESGTRKILAVIRRDGDGYSWTYFSLPPDNGKPRSRACLAGAPPGAALFTLTAS